MPRTRKKVFIISIDATVNVIAGYELEAVNVDDAKIRAESLFRNEFGISLEQCHDAGFRFENIDVTGSEVES